MPDITYHVHDQVSADEFVAVLEASTLARRRPVEDRACIQGMLDHADLVVTARLEGTLIGIARSLTDFSYVAYLSDLAVDAAHQRRGVGRRLLQLTKQQLGPRCKLLLLAAPAAVAYYPKLGFEQHPQAWMLPPDREVA